MTPRRVRPPYDSPDPRFDHLRGADVEAWRVAVRLDRVVALREPLAGLVVTDLEHHVLEWLAGWEVGTVATIVGLLHRARAAGPLLDVEHPWGPPVMPAVASARPDGLQSGTGGNG